MNKIKFNTKKLKSLVKKEGLSIHLFSRKLEKETGHVASTQSIYIWLRGTFSPNVDSIYFLSKYFGIAMEDFFIIEK